MSLAATASPQPLSDEDSQTTGKFSRSEVAEAVALFHAAFRLPQQASPSVQIDSSLASLRIALLEEEFGEFVAASDALDLVAIADALADIVYVTYGTAATYGIDLDAILGEVHRANMSKLDENGDPLIRDDGKVLKSPLYRRPDVRLVLQQQLPIALPHS